MRRRALYEYAASSPLTLPLSPEGEGTEKGGTSALRNYCAGMYVGSWVIWSIAEP